jgi:hypothetical protein
MHDKTIEERLRSTLHSEAASLPLTVSADELERRLVLRRRDRHNRRFGLLAAGVAAIAVGTAFTIAIGPFRGPSVAATPQPTVGPSAVLPSLKPTSGPVDLLPALEPTVGSVDFDVVTQPGDPSSTEIVPEAAAFDGVRMDAREAGVKFVCSGPDPVEITWGIAPDRTSIAGETVDCDNAIHSFRYDLAAMQPLVADQLLVHATRRTEYRILVESFGFTNDPAPTALPAFAAPVGTVVLDTRIDAGVEPSRTPGTGGVGSVPSRGVYRVAMVCIGTGSARWTIGAEDTRDFIDAGDVPCDGAALGFESSLGLPSRDSTVFVTTDPGNSWHLVITDPNGAPSFIPPSFDMWAGADMEGSPTSGPATCVSHGDQGDSCGAVYSAHDGAAVVGVPTGSDVTFTLTDGWRIGQIRVEAVDRAIVRTDPTTVEITDVGFVEDGGERVTMSVGMLPAGDWIVRVSLNATKGSDRFGAVYEMPLRVGG